MPTIVEFKWTPDYRFLMLVLIVFVLTMFATRWQLERAQQKIDLLVQLEHTESLPPVFPEEMDFSSKQNFRNVLLQGRWREEQFILDNRTRTGRVGYEVLGVFEHDKQFFLVNRGWIPGGADRSSIPEPEVPLGVQSISGYLYKSPKNTLVLKEQQWRRQWPERLQAIDLSLVSERLNLEVFPYRVRMHEATTGAFDTRWKIHRKGPEMHYGYAVQWFLMGITVLIMALFANSNLLNWLKSRHKKSSLAK